MLSRFTLPIGILFVAVVSVASAQMPARIDHFSQAQLVEIAKDLDVQARAANGSASKKLSEYEGHYTMIALREKSGGAEVHEQFADLFLIVEGHARLLSGGTVVDGKSSDSGEIQGSALRDATEEALNKGDVVHIPAGLPHQLLLDAGDRLLYFVVKVKESSANSKAAEKQSWVGDSPADAGPLATDLSSTLEKKKVSRAIQKVADWQLDRVQAGFDQDWTFAALYSGFMAVPKEVSGQKYRDAMLQMAKRFQWQLGPRLGHADDEAIGQTYLDLYFMEREPARIAPIVSNIDAVMRLPDDKDKPLWWWCDALFMAPPMLARLAKATGERKYLDFMDKQWWITSDLLYSPENHLFFRDKSYLDKHQSNGKSIFWSRGNGWVFAGLARVLEEMPADYPSRPKYIAQYKAMAEDLASLQGSDGLWRPGLLDAGAYPLPEVSGSAFYTYGFAYGVRTGLLNRQKYLPVVERSWSGLLSHVYQDGRLGCIQPIGGSPDVFTPTSSYVFGTGAFLLAGSEVYRLAR